jgi:two-component system NtrC family response regulator
MAEILVIDDDPQFAGMLARLVQESGHGVSCATTLAEARQRLGRDEYDVVFLDIHLPDGSGLEELPDLRSRDERAPEVIIVTGFGDAESAELAIRYGAWDFMPKGASTQKMILSLARALQYRESRRAIPRRLAFHAPDLVGDSSALRSCRDIAAQAAGGDAALLITGETGTGKELFATAVHENSKRCNGPFVVVDCATLPQPLLGSVLFGHEKGAFTGADSRREGLVKQADGGTLFLDEIGDMPLDTPRAFLRVLQEHRFRPVGAQREEQSDFRLIAATNRDLERMAENGEFRSDLLFRLRAMSLRLPPLRERAEDTDLLLAHFVTRECRLRGIPLKGVSDGFAEALRSHDWPGNVRELANAIIGAVAAAESEPILYAKHLPMHIRLSLAVIDCDAHEDREQASPGTAVFRSLSAPLEPFRESREIFEARYLRALVDQAGADIEEACRLSQLSRPHVYALLRKHGLSLRDHERSAV